MTGRPPLLSLLTSRETLLRRLADAPHRKRELEAALEASPSTIDRALRDLENRNLIERADGRHRLTAAGKLAVDEYDRSVRRLDTLGDAGDVLAALPTDAPLDPAFLDGAQVAVARPSDPQQPARTLEKLIATADRHRAFAPAFLPHIVDVYREAILDGLVTEVALTPSVLDRLLAEHRGAVAQALETDRLAVREAPPALPYTLVVSERPGPDVAVLLVFEEGTLRGIVYSSDAEALEWARGTLAAIWEDAKPLSIADE